MSDNEIIKITEKTFEEIKHIDKQGILVCKRINDSIRIQRLE